MSEARRIIRTVADATGSVRSTLDALEQLLSVMHDDDHVDVDEAREVHELAQRLSWDAYMAAKASRSVTYHALMDRDEEVVA